nr:MFS transporter [Chelatococcus sp. YT9]
MAVASQTLTIIPVFLIGSLSPLIRDDITLDAFGLGLAVAVFYSLSAIGAGAFGRAADRVGPWRTTGAGLVLTALALLGIAAIGWNAGMIITCLAFAGLANGWVQPSTNLAVSRHVHGTRQGFAFGMKQSSIPLATMAGGLAVPFVGLTMGWRWAFGLAALATAIVWLGLPRDTAPPQPRHGAARATMPFGTLMTLAAMSGCGAGAANGMAAFLVSSITAAGHAEAGAGIVLAMGSIASIIVRISAGLVADRRDFPMMLAVSLLFSGGAAGYACLALGQGWLAITIGTALGFGLGWGWSGLSTLAVVRGSPGAAGAATGVTQAGVFVGAVLGPLAFGWIAQTTSYAAAWWTMVVLGVAAAGLAIIAHRQLGEGPISLADADLGREA